MSSSIIIEAQIIAINSDTLFKGCYLKKKSDEEFMEFFAYELTPYSLSIFDDVFSGKERNRHFTIASIRYHIKILKI